MTCLETVYFQLSVSRDDVIIYLNISTPCLLVSGHFLSNTDFCDRQPWLYQLNYSTTLNSE